MVRLLAAVPSAVLALVLPVLYFALALMMTGVVILLKWLVVGRYLPRVEPMWSFFVCARS